MVTRPCSLGRWLSYRERRSVVISVLHRLLILLAVASSAVAAAIFLLPPAASPAANMKLFAYVSEPNEPYNGIWLKDANGALVTISIPARTRSLSTTGRLGAASIS